MKDSQRLVSLDAFRGLTILLMIVVNTPGSWKYVYPPFRHSEWHGCTPTDLVFPFFLFIVGVAMFYSFRKYDQKLTSPAFRKILKRTFLIFLIGLILNAFPRFDFEHLRIMGVLQRIALAYGLGAILVLLLPGWGRWLASFAVLFGYWLLLWAMGGDDPYGLETNIVRKTDMFVFGASHVYKGFGIPFDPEGLLSGLPAMINVILGYQVGEMIARAGNTKKIPLKLIVVGASGIIMGLIWNNFFPINKPIWTSSYVLYTVGIASILLAVFVWLIDMKGFKKWAQPLLVYGMNPLFIYVLSGLWAKTIIYLIHVAPGGVEMNGYTWLYQKIFVPIGGDMFGSFLFAIFHGVLFWFIGWLLYRRKIFIKI